MPISADTANLTGVKINTTAFSRLLSENVYSEVNAQQLIATGDCGLILRADGSYHAFVDQNCDISNSSEFSDNDSHVNEATERLRMLNALSLACKHPQIMQVLLNLSEELGAV